MSDANATNRDSALHQLDMQQNLAVVALANGATHDAAADAAGVHRTTVTRWANHHPAFIAQRNRLQAEAAATAAAEAATVRRRITTAALETIEAEIAAGNADAAFRWLKVSPPTSGVAACPGPMEAVAVVDAVRLSMPGVLDELPSQQRPTYADAERLIRSRLQEP